MNECASRQPTTIPTQTINTCRLLFISDKRVSFIKTPVTLQCFVTLRSLLAAARPISNAFHFYFRERKTHDILKNLAFFCDFLITSLSSFFIFLRYSYQKITMQFLKISTRDFANATIKNKTLVGSSRSRSLSLTPLSILSYAFCLLSFAASITCVHLPFELNCKSTCKG